VSAPIGSVVIPAHDEAAVIERGLDALCSGFAPGELEVVVVCNGCTDDTAARARRSPYPVQVLELDEASKPAALRAGDAAVRAFPRIYLDADMVLPSAAARAVIERLADGSLPAARPAVRFDTTGASRVVRRYFAARTRTPSVTSALWGPGVYAVSAEGRARFDEYPDVVADDLFAADQFGPDEYEIVDTEPATFFAPRSTRDLVNVLRRWSRGASELREGETSSAPTWRTTLRELSRQPATSPSAALDAAVYVLLALAGRITWQLGAPARWERDDSSRTS
jgi:hypothetical protein